MRLKRGVSMVVLAVTVVVMAILATTAIIYLEDTGVIKKSKEAVKDTNLIQVTELARTAWNTANSKMNVTLADLQQAVNDALILNRVDIADYNIIVTKERVYVSKDFISPVITNSSMAYTNDTVAVGLNFGSVGEDDYPLVVDYYIKSATITSEDGYELKHTMIISSGVASNYTFTGLEAGGNYSIKAVVRDINGNTATARLNATTSGGETTETEVTPEIEETTTETEVTSG